MANDKITMLKLKRLLQLLAGGQSLNRISAELHMSKRTVSKYKKAALESGQSFSELLHLDDEQLCNLLQPESPTCLTDERKNNLDVLLNDYINELKRPHVTILLLWEEYIARYPEGYQYTQFKKYLLDYKKSHAYAYHNTYIPGEEWQIDFAGDALYLTDKVTEKGIPVVLLCCILPSSGYAFAIALAGTTMEHLFYGLSKGLEYLGGVPKTVKSDNMKQWVKRSSRYEPSFTEAVEQWCLHYGLTPQATRVRHPRDKGPVEGLVNKLYQYIYARIRDEKFYSLDVLNNRIFGLMDEFNAKDFRGKATSRLDVFLQQEKPLLGSLPDQPYRFKYQKDFTVSSSYHVPVGKEMHYYSIPYEYVSRKARVVWDMEYVEIYVDNKRVAVHRRSFQKYGYTTEEKHMPANHIAYKRSREYNAAAIQKRALLIGPRTKEAIDIILSGKIFPQQSYRTCQGVFSLAGKYGEKRLEAACDFILSRTQALTLTMLQNVLAKGLERAQAENSTKVIATTPPNETVRGAKAYSNI